MQLQKTRSGKTHFPILDGLRGTAALLVVAFHLMESVTVDQSANLMRHGYLAVDFFFALSGYVIGYAYDDRWRGMSLGTFARIRLVRLHPVIIVGTLFGFVSYFLDPFVSVPHAPSIGATTIALVAGFLLIPSWSLPDRGTDYFSYNGVFWTLFAEYMANVLYAVALRLLPLRALACLTVAAALLLVWRATVHDTLHLGYDWQTVEMAPVRLAYPFLAGLLLYRSGIAKRQPRFGWISLSAILFLAFATPHLVAANGWSRNGLFDAGVVVLLFPALIAAGAHPVGSQRWTKFCETLGRISYPLYGTHYALVYVYADWIKTASPPRLTATLVGCATWVCAVALGWATVRFADEPARRALQRFRPHPRTDKL